MPGPKPKEKRTEVLYAKVKPSNKKFVRGQYKKLGYSTLSEYIDTMLDEHRENTIKWKKKK